MRTPEQCGNCTDWGESVNPLLIRGPTIRCCLCGRHTFPNLGVNYPAGIVVAFTATYTSFRDLVSIDFDSILNIPRKKRGL